MAQPDCPLCGGTGWKTVERIAEDEKDKRVSWEKPVAGTSEKKRVWAVPCDCTGSDRAARTMARARIPRRYQECDFDNLDTNLYEGSGIVEPLKGAEFDRSLAEAKLLVKGFADNYPVGTNETGLLLMGGCGTGKTHLAVAALRQIVVRGHAGIFYDYRELLKEIQHSWNSESQTTELDVLEPVLTTELLLIDDLASTKASEWVRETVGHILNTRYNEHRVTILTTNFLDQPKPRDPDNVAGPRGKATPVDINWSRPKFRMPTGQTIPAHTEDTLSERLGERIRSRLYETCRTIELFALDYRKYIRRAHEVVTRDS